MRLSIANGLDILNVIVALGFLLYAASIAVPPLGRRIHDGFWPPLFADSAQRRAAWLLAGSKTIMWLCASYYFGSQVFIPLICGGQRLLANLQLVAVMVGCIALVGVSFIQRRHQLVSQHPPRPILRLPRPVALALLGATGLMLVGICAGAVTSFRRISASSVGLESIAMESDGAGWAVGSQDFASAVYRLSGGAWTRVDVGNAGILTDIDLTGTGEGWVVGNNSTLFRLSGGSWSPVPAPVGELRAIDMLSADEGWAVGNHGAIIHYKDGAWTQVASPTEAGLEDISMVSADEGWAVGGGDYARSVPSVILHYRDGAWALADNPTALPLSAVQMVSADEGWAVGGTRFSPVARVILHYRAGAWAPEPAPPGIPLEDLRMSPDGTGWAVGGDFFDAPLDCPTSTRSEPINAILRFESGAWRETEAPDGDDLYGMNGLALDPAGQPWIAGEGALLRRESGDWQIDKPVIQR
ncbi:MAG TPA: hypothetical protein VGE07_08800 [Herpetosiphonaceae bacterium]